MLLVLALLTCGGHNYDQDLGHEANPSATRGLEDDLLANLAENEEPKTACGKDSGGNVCV